MFSVKSSVPGYFKGMPKYYLAPCNTVTSRFSHLSPGEGMMEYCSTEGFKSDRHNLIQLHSVSAHLINFYTNFHDYRFIHDKIKKYVIICIKQEEIRSDEYVKFIEKTAAHLINVQMH
jgi:hypothetical protein